MKVCAEPGCPTLVRARRCPAHQLKYSRARGSAPARGYDRQHQNRRAEWDAKVAEGKVTCWRCGRLIRTGTPWDLGHDDDDRTKYRGPEHAHCNRSAGGRAAHR